MTSKASCPQLVFVVYFQVGCWTFCEDLVREKLLPLVPWAPQSLSNSCNWNHGESLPPRVISRTNCIHVIAQISSTHSPVFFHRKEIQTWSNQRRPLLNSQLLKTDSFRNMMWMWTDGEWSSLVIYNLILCLSFITTKEVVCILWLKQDKCTIVHSWQVSRLLELVKNHYTIRGLPPLINRSRARIKECFYTLILQDSVPSTLCCVLT